MADAAAAPIKPSLQRLTSEAEEEEDNAGGGLKLQRSVTLFNGVSIIVGCIIGSGIFVSPTGVLAKAGSVGMSLIIWVACGLYCMIGAYCYAELGTLIRKTGGDYAYIMQAFGPFIAFIRLWIEAIVVRPCSATIVAITFAIYLLRPFYPTCAPPPGATEMIAAATLILLTAINCISVRAATFVQDFFTVAKVGALVLIIMTGAVLLCTGRAEYRENFDDIFYGTSKNIGDYSLAIMSGLFAYNGWNYLNFIVEELKNPKRNLPLAIVISMVLCTVIYTLTNIALFTAVSPVEMLESPAVAVEFAQKLYGSFAWIMPVCVASSTIGSANGVILTSSRLFYAGAREGQMPRLLTMINEQTLTPMPAVIFTGLLSLGYLSISNNVFSLINYVQIVYFLAIGVAMLALLYLRKLLPHKKRPIKVNLAFPIIFLAGCIFLVIVPIYAAPKDAAIGMGIMLTSVPVYFLFIYNNFKVVHAVTDCVTRAAQKVFLVRLEDKTE